MKPQCFSVIKPGPLKLEDFVKIVNHHLHKALSVDFDEGVWDQYYITVSKSKWDTKLLRDATEEEKGFD